MNFELSLAPNWLLFRVNVKLGIDRIEAVFIYLVLLDLCVLFVFAWQQNIKGYYHCNCVHSDVVHSFPGSCFVATSVVHHASNYLAQTTHACVFDMKLVFQTYMQVPGIIFCHQQARTGLHLIGNHTES